MTKSAVLRMRLSCGLLVIGLLFMLSALALVLYNAWDSWRAENCTRELLTQVEEAGMGSLSATNASSAITIDGHTYVGLLSIPNLDLNLPVQSSWTYSGLSLSPCIYSGSIKAQNLVIAAHNYPAHFGNIKSLQFGDSIQYSDVAGNTHNYKVVASDVLSPQDTELMTSSDGWDLTLFTCTFDGGSRVTVRATQV